MLCFSVVCLGEGVIEVRLPATGIYDLVECWHNDIHVQKSIRHTGVMDSTIYKAAGSKRVGAAIAV